VLLGAAATADAVDPASEIRIVRDRYGVPHVYADTRDALAYGAGYALAQDRLWQMHVFRKIARGELSDLVGPSVVDIDKDVRFFTYTEDERAARLGDYPPELHRGLEQFARGVNAWIDEVERDPSKMPFEFIELGVQPIPDWTVDDSVALGDVLILAFGSGGGNELAQGALLRRLVDRLGGQRGRLAFDDLVRTVDPDSPVTIPPELDWRATPTHADEAEVASRRALEDDARLTRSSPPGAADAAALGTAAQAALVPDAASAERAATRLERALARLEAMFHFGSNAQIVGPGRAEGGNTLQTGGPQVGYLVPQWLADFGMHGAGLDVTGMTFAGVGPAVLIGRGNGFAWTTTTGSSDLTDTYVERLQPGNPRAYRFGGRFEPMACRTETYTFRGVPFDSEEICRTRHGPVLEVDEANGVAYSLRYSWFNREQQTVEGFFRMNETSSLGEYATAASLLASNHNMFYTDDQGHYGYWHPGNHVVRAPGVDLRLPQDGRGGSEWRSLLPVRKVPHAIDFDRGWLVNWNNQPAAGWPRERAFDARDNVDDLSSAHSGADGSWDFQDLNRNLRHAAFADHFMTWFRSSLPAPSALGSDLSRRALEVVRDWDGLLVDLNGDGDYDSAGTTILRRWLAVLRDDVFADDLGDDVDWARVSTELWRVISPDATARMRYGWLGGRKRVAVAAAAFDRAVSELAAEFESDDPSSWRSEAQMEHYQRLNSDLPPDLALLTACGELESAFGRCPVDPGDDSGWPGDVEDHIAMDRGTYNHIVEYLDRPVGAGPLGQSRSLAGSVIPPGQSGFVSPTGQEDRHFEDQLPLYVNWRYKPMPLLPAEVRRETESTTTLPYAP
jgi:penicillin G amidase